jgi:hypothetical protein
MDVYQRDEYRWWTARGNIVRVLSDMERPSVDGEQRRKWKVVLQELNGESDSHDVDPDGALDAITHEHFRFIQESLSEFRTISILSS